MLMMMILLILMRIRTTPSVLFLREVEVLVCLITRFHSLNMNSLIRDGPIG